MKYSLVLSRNKNPDSVIRVIRVRVSFTCVLDLLLFSFQVDCESIDDYLLQSSRLITVR